MKRLLAPALMLTLSVPSFAGSTSDQQTVIIQNNETTNSIVLNTQSTRTMYRTETVPSTCYRQVLDGYRRVCDYNYFNQIVSVNFAGDPPVGPHPAPGPHPRDPGAEPKPSPGGGGDHDGGDHDGGNHGGGDHDGDHGGGSYPTPRQPVCHDEPVYRDEAYSCMETVQIPYEVFDHNTEATVNVRISAAPSTKPQAGNCGIDFNLNGDNLSATNTCADYLAFANIGSMGSGYSKSYNYDVKLFDAAAVLAPLNGNLQDMHVDGSDLSFKTGTLSGATNFTLKLFVQRKRFLAKDITLINRQLNANEFTYTAIDARTGYVHIDLDRVASGFQSNKKNVINVTLDVTLPTAGTLLNGRNTPTLHQEEGITIR